MRAEAGWAIVVEGRRVVRRRERAGKVCMVEVGGLVGKGGYSGTLCIGG